MGTCPPLAPGSEDHAWGPSRSPFQKLNLYEPGNSTLSYQDLSKVGSIVFRCQNRHVKALITGHRLLLALAMAECGVTCWIPMLQAAGLYHQRTGSKNKAMGQNQPLSLQCPTVGAEGHTPGPQGGHQASK